MKHTFTAGQRLQIAGEGDFFRLLGTVTPVTLEFYFQGREIAERLDVEAGYAEQFRSVRFDRVDITSAAAQTVQFETALGSEIRYDRGAASVTVTNNGGPFTQAAATVTNANGQLLAENTARRYLMVQNNDASGIVYVTVDGTAATLAKGIKLGPGDSLEIPGFAPTGTINAIGSIASNANVVVVEG